VVTRSVMFAAVGAVHDRPKVVNNELEVRPCIFINFTADHRFLDGGRTRDLNRIVIKKSFFIVNKINIFLDLGFF